MSAEYYQATFKARIVDAKDAEGKLTKPEFRQYVTKRLGFLFWKWDPEFDIRNHIRIYDGKLSTQFQNGILPVNKDTVAEACDDLMYKPYVPKRSPWEILLIHDFKEMDPITGERVGPGSTVMVLRIHHCLGDGFSIMKAFNTNFTQASEFDTAQPKYIRPSRGSALLRALDFLFSAPYEFLTEAKNAVDVNSWHVPRSQITYRLNSAVSHRIPIEYIKEVKNLNKASFTGLILECFTAALRKFMTEAGYEVPEVIHCVTPLPVPGHPDKMRNHM
jgi:hypothetical protein